MLVFFRDKHTLPQVGTEHLLLQILKRVLLLLGPSLRLLLVAVLALKLLEINAGLLSVLDVVVGGPARLELRNVLAPGLQVKLYHFGILEGSKVVMLSRSLAVLKLLG